MNATQATPAENSAPVVSVELAESIFQTPTPTIRLSYPLARGSNHRKTRAALRRLAAEVDLATPATEGWVVDVHHDGDLCGRVVVELMHGGQDEARRAMSVLRGVVAVDKHSTASVLP